MNIVDPSEWERLFGAWSRAKARHLDFMERASLSAASNSSRTADMLAAASIAMADMQAACARLRAMTLPGPFAGR